MLKRFQLILAAAAVALGMLVLGAASADAAPLFPTTGMLDNFKLDGGVLDTATKWTTPALGEAGMAINASNDLSGLSTTSWSAALWKQSTFSSPVEVWATVDVGGTADANLYANVTGGASSHPASGYFVDFGGSSSVGSRSAVSLWRIDSPLDERMLNTAPAPYTRLHTGDKIGLSIVNGFLIAWYVPSGGAPRAVVSWHDITYTSGNTAIEDITGPSFGFSAFGGGTSTVAASHGTTTTIASSNGTVAANQTVTYSATVKSVGGTPTGTVEFTDNGQVIPGCGTRALNAGGSATCAVKYRAPGAHTVDARYAGSANGAFTGSENYGDAMVVVSLKPRLRVKHSAIVATFTCPASSGGCRVTPRLVIQLPGVTRTITLKAATTSLKAGRKLPFSFKLSGHAKSRVDFYLRHHHHPHLIVVLRLGLRDKNGARGTEVVTYTIRKASDLSKL